MAFVLTHPVSATWTSMVADTGHRAANWLRSHVAMTSQERAGLYVSRMPVALIVG